ncbi:MAG TPA: nitrogen fixation protein FixH [Rhizobacter sp.]|nr:nitrogen fixation protein FixH [Rhizobacter sp.]
MKTQPAAQPWWRFGIVWLVIAGPVAVVLASTVTAWVAWHNVDPVLIEAPVPATERDASNAPALKVRNHAATPRQQ